jgi:hypothetical protein
MSAGESEMSVNLNFRKCFFGTARLNALALLLTLLFRHWSA